MIVYYSNIKNLMQAGISEASALPFEKRCAPFLLQTDPDVCRKILACRNEKDRFRSLTAALLLLSAFRTLSGNPALTQLRYGYGPHGKPFSEDYPEYCFSVSHSGDYAICIADTQEAGIDIQEYRSADYHGITRRFYTPQEQNFVFLPDDAGKEERFYRIWACKEAFIKYTGNGISEGLTTFSTDPVRQLVLRNDQPVAALFEPLQLPGYSCAVCTALPAETSAAEIRELFPADFS